MKHDQRARCTFRKLKQYTAVPFVVWECVLSHVFKDTTKCKTISLKMKVEMAPGGWKKEEEGHIKEGEGEH